MPRIAICAPSRSITADDAARVSALAADYAALDLHFHPQCFFEWGHFAGSDKARCDALVECANDPSFDAVWFARGGYGAVRVAEDAIARMGREADNKTYLGYSDGGMLLGGLYANRIGKQLHAPMPTDIRREGGEAAVRRTLAYLSGDRSGLELSLDDRPTAAFNLMTLAMLCGTPLMPDLAGHVVLIEEVAEYLYAVDRLMFHVTSHLHGIAGLRLGRVSQVPENDAPFGHDAQEIVKHWCARHHIRFLGSADIGHDIDNKIVPFGLAEQGADQ